jgi:hypothetical protein
LFISYYDKCKEVYPYENGNGFNIMDNEKNHSIKHGGNDIAKYADMSCETPEDAHKFWIKLSSKSHSSKSFTNQGPEAALTMMHYKLRKEASALLCEGVQCTFNLNISKYTSKHLNSLSARLNDGEIQP